MLDQVLEMVSLEVKECLALYRHFSFDPFWDNGKYFMKWCMFIDAKLSVGFKEIIVREWCRLV